MRTFIYKAKDGPGKTVHGELSAESRSAAVANLDVMGYIPVWVREKDTASRKTHDFRRRRISQRDVTVFTRQLASLTKSGVPLLKALYTIGDQTENSGLRRVVEDLEGTVRDGNMLSGALSKYPALFPELYINMIRAGESAGKLDTILFRLSEAREKEEDLRRKVQAAIAYPLLVVTVGMITVFALLAFFLPRVVDLFENYQDLPLATKMLIGLSGFFSRYAYWIILIFLLFAVIFRRLVSLETGKLFIDRIKLHMPLINRFIRESDLARFARTLSLLIDAGIPIDKALTLSANTLRNAVLKEEVEKVRQNTVQQGMPFSMGLKKTRYFPPLFSNMAAVGEEAGRLDESLDEVASFYEKEIDQQSRLATSLLEPILILVVGGIVAFIVMAMLLPIFKIGSIL